MTPSRKWLLALAAGPVLAAAGVAAWVAWPLPAGLTARPANLGVTLLDRHGLALRQARAGDGSRAGWHGLDAMDPQLLQAFVALEDRRFFAHGGVDARAVARAAWQMARARRVVSGASTITMQVARLLTPLDRGVRAKVAQALWAWRLEHHLTKQEILEQYLNRVPLGQGTVGVGAAADLYFDASVSQLSLGQAALIAGLASAPSALNPMRAAERARARRARALERLVLLGHVSADEAARAGREPLLAGSSAAPFLAPHFTSRVLQWVSDSLRGAAEGRLVTSLDLVLQAELEAEVRNTVVLLREREVRQAAAVVLDNATGEILAWVGSPDFGADTAGQVDMVTSPRQPGSTLKPFLYALALERGYTAASVLPDVPAAYRTATGAYQPRNYDRRFHGPVRVREALASSFNVPAVEVADRLGAGSLLRTLHAAGFVSLDAGADHYGLGLALGNGDVSLLELANAYRGLANGGSWSATSWLASSPPSPPSPFASRGSAVLVLDMLSDAEARIAGFGADTPFDFPFQVAIKTGTSHHFTDNWAVGVTGGFTVAVWVGNFSGRPMRRVSGVTGAGPLLHRAVMAAARRYAPGVLPSPVEVGGVRARVCRLSGGLAGAYCQGVDEWFLPGTAPRAVCDWHGAGGVRWPAEYAEWVGTHAEEAARLGGSGGAPVIRHASLAASADELRIVSPRDGDRYEIPPGTDARYASVALRAVGGVEDEPVTWYVDGVRVPGARWSLVTGEHRVRAVGASGRAAEVRVSVR